MTEIDAVKLISRSPWRKRWLHNRSNCYHIAACLIRQSDESRFLKAHWTKETKQGLLKAYYLNLNLLKIMQLSEIDSKKVSSYKKCIDTLEQAPRRAGAHDVRGDTEGWVCSALRRESQGDLTAGRWRETEGVFSKVHRDRTRGSRQNLQGNF